MGFFAIFLIGISLAMDAFAVSMTTGLKLKKPKLNESLSIGLTFGFFQFFMPVLGYFFTYFFMSIIENINIDSYTKWIAFVLLFIIGINMIKESRECANEDNEKCKIFKLNFKYLLPLAIATSIDAFSVGVTFALLDVHILYAGIVIGITTIFISTAGVYLGSKLGEKLKSKAEVFGGIVLMLIGLNILIS